MQIAMIKKPKKPFKSKTKDNHEKLRREKLIKYLQSELRSCTTHGLPHIVNAELHWLERVYWTFNFIFCCGIIIMLLLTQYLRFLNTPVVMSVEMDYFNWNISYPAITLCPSSKINEDLFGTLVNDSREQTGKNLHSYYWSIATASLDNIDRLSIQSPEIANLIDAKDYVDIAALLFADFANTSLTMNIEWPMVVQPALTEMGMCHVINSNVAEMHNPFKWKDEETRYAKNNIELSAHDVDFFTQIMNYADIYKGMCDEVLKSYDVMRAENGSVPRRLIDLMVYVHSPDEVAISTSPSFTYDVEGFLLMGFQVWSAKISDKLRHFPISIRKCRLIDEPINNRYPVYTYNHCMLDCKIKMVIRLCGCVPHFYKTIDHERICDFTELACVIQYKNELLTLSATDNTLSAFGNSSLLPRSPSDCGCLSSCESELYLKNVESFLPQASMSRLRISVSTFPRVRVKREFIFTTYDIILKTGGVINLCIGSSVISIMELIMTIIRIPLGELTERLVKKIKDIKLSSQ